MLAGSLPPGVADDFYVRVVEAVRVAADLAGTTAPRIAADTSGAALLALVTGGVGIDLIKPNAEELAELLGASDEAALEDGPDEAIALARSLPASACGRAWSRSAPSAPRSSPRRPRGSRGLPA